MSNRLRTAAVRAAAAAPEGSKLRRVLLAALFPSTFDVGDPVWVEVQGQRIAGNVRAATFTSSKVRYAVSVEVGGGPTTLHNLDSILLEAREGVRVEFGADNYS